MQLVVFHYHLLPGGVTQVITSSAVAALKYLPDIEGITLVSGSNKNTKNVTDTIREKVGIEISNGKKIECITLSELGYISDMNKYPDPQSIKKMLNNYFSGDLWWVHNYHIGKNPFFTEAILQSAVENPEQKIVLQIHDFPEASRYSNLETLYKYVSYPLYPASQNIKYVTINSRDRNYLITAGIPEKIIFLLKNPVEPLNIEEKVNNKNYYAKIDKILSKSEPSYIKGAPLLVYPVRTIRRKNVLEAGLLAKCSRVPVNLLPTLPGVSKTETGYSQLVDDCYRKKLIPGAAQAGLVLEDEGITFPDIMNAGKIIISSSVQEGFGYLFINSLQWKKPLIARKLDIQKDFSNLFTSDFSYFYNKINIPLRKSLRIKLIQEYNLKLAGLEKFLDYNIISNLKNQIEQILKKDSIDFSFLSPAMQRDFLQDIINKELLEETRRLNTLLLKQMEKLLTADTGNFKEPDIEKFNLNNHAAQIKKIISSFKYNIQPENFHKINVNYSLMTSYINTASISLLFDPI